jgi:abhydrolase domain-containing protein 17
MRTTSFKSFSTHTTIFIFRMRRQPRRQIARSKKDVPGLSRENESPLLFTSMVDLLPGVNALLYPAPSPATYTHRLPGLMQIASGEFVLHMRLPASRRLVLFSHGNAEDIGHLSPLLAQLSAALDADAAAYEYPGYGLCPGRPSGLTIGWAAENVLRWARATYEKIVLVGRSLGTGPATYQASLDRGEKVTALALISPYLSIDEIVADWPGRLAWLSYLTPTVFDNRGLVANLPFPILIQHGDSDRVINVRHARELSKLCRVLGSRLTIYNDCGHNDLGANGALQDLLDFLFHWLKES